MKAKNTFFRQGDVGITKLDALPAGIVPVKNKGRIILAHGEVTGHAHAIAAAEAREFTWADAGGVVHRYLEVLEKKFGAPTSLVTHEEHAPIPLPPGFYEITIQREYHPEAIRNVAD